MQFVRRFQFILALLVVLTACCAHLMAQGATSQVSGVVTDASGAVIPGAQVQITNTDTGAVRTVTSGGRGEYIFSNLPIGPYTLQVKKDGFETYVQSGIVLQVNTNPSIIVSLHVGSQTQEVTVTADAAMVETQNSSVSQVVNPQLVVDLPLNGRQAEQLIAASGAAVSAVPLNTSSTVAATSNIGTLDYPTATAYSIAGSMPNATNYFLDGGQHLDYRTDIALPMPFPDALSQFSINISALPANLGIHPGGVVNGVTRSGGNAFHGNVFDFVRNGVMDATTRTYASTVTGTPPVGARDTLVRNQFGGTFGGPIKRDKLFVFGGYQGTIQNSTTGVSTIVLPTPAMLGIGSGTGPGEANTYPGEGDFTALLAGNAGGCTVENVKSAYATGPNSVTPTNANTSNNIVPASDMGGASGTTSAAIIQQYLTKYAPTSGFYDNCGDYHYTAAPNYTFENQILGRVDWQRSAADRIFGRYFVSKYSAPSYYTPSAGLASSNGVGLADQIQSVAIGDTYVLSAHAINSITLAFDRTATERVSNPGIPTLCTLGVAVTCPVANNIDLLFSTTAGSGTVKPGFEGYDYENSYGVNEGYSWTNGKHQFNIGAAFLHVQMNGDGTFQQNPEITFNTGVTGAALADAATGNVDTVLQGMGQLSRDGQNQPSAYVQDTWKLLSRFQLTGGLRWDPFIAQHNKYGEVGDFSLLGYYQNIPSQEYVNAPPGMTFQGDKGFHGNSDTNNYPLAFAPRLGFVWDITGKGNETLRGGYGYFYDTSILWNTMHVVLNPPWGETLSFTPLTVAAGGGLANPYAGSNGPNPFPFFNPPKTFTFPTNGTFIFEGQNNKPTNVQSWNLAFQRQMTSNLLLSVNYMGSKTSHLWLSISNNSAQYLSQYGTSSSCTIPYNVGTAAAPNIVNLNYTVCNEPSGVTETDTTGYKVTNVNARRALNLANPKWGATLQGGVTTASSWGDAAYNALLITVEKRMSHGFSALGNYTWSRCMDDGEIGQDIGETANIGPMNPNNVKATSWGDCTYNNKGIINLSLIGQSPHLANRAMNAVASGWNGSGIFSFQTGYPYTQSANYDASLTGVGFDRAVRVADPKVPGAVAANPTCTDYPSATRTVLHWYNPCAFTFAPLGTFSTALRNDQVGPANWNLNLAVFRDFPLPEKVTLQLRAEAFNALNHAEIGNPSITLASSTSSETYNSNAGLISTSGPGYQPRIFQLAIKASF